MPRIIPGGQTSIAGALSFSIDQMNNNNIDSTRGNRCIRRWKS